MGEIMLSFEEALEETTTPTPVDEDVTPVDEVVVEPVEQPEPTVVHEGTTAAARMLELAAITADRLVTDAQTEAESLVSSARATADAISESSHSEARRVAAQLSRSRDELAAELDRERVTALAGLADEKAALEEQIARLHELQTDYRSTMRQHLDKQLSLLDSLAAEAPAAIAG
jgi:cell division septum initiation protein DivIVA